MELTKFPNLTGNTKEREATVTHSNDGEKAVTPQHPSSKGQEQDKY